MIDGGMVIVGAGLAGAEAALALRTGGYRGAIALIGGEAWAPYERPPLSKTFLKGDGVPEKLLLRAPKSYADQDIDLRLGCPVERIDPAQRAVVLAGGETVRYQRLLLATGGEARRPDMPGAALDGVLVLKSLDDALQLRQRLAHRPRVVIIGGGFVGMEMAATARLCGCEVTVVEGQPRVLARTLAPRIGQHLQAVHAQRGVQIVTGAAVAAVEGTGSVQAVRLADGCGLPADLVLLAVGNQPSDALAREAGLACEAGGILVDARGATSDASIFAAGDCAVRHFEGFDTPLRLESVQQALAQARGAAAAMLDQAAPADEVPWFWSDQFDIKLQMVGLPLPGDTELLRGDPASGRFSILFQNAQRLSAIQCVNAAGDFAAAKKMIADRRTYPVERLCNSEIPLRDTRLACQAA